MRATDIIRHRRQRARQANNRGRRLARGMGILGLVGALCLLVAPLVAAIAGAVGALVLTRDLPDIDQLARLSAPPVLGSATTRLYAWGEPAVDGLRPPVLIDEIVDPRLGEAGWLVLDALPPHVVAAHLAATDPDFLSAGPPAIMTDLFGWWQTGTVPAERSPITSELISHHLRGSEAEQSGDSWRGLQDWLLGRQIEERYGREKQLEWVLNTTYYGHLAYGIEAAARVYFDKGAADLSVGEAALLAAVARNPAANPFDDLLGARRGQRDVLAAMMATAALPAGDAATAAESPLTLAPPPGSASVVPDFARQVRRELEALLGPARLVEGGLQVETTLDLALQGQVSCVLAARNEEPGGSGGGPPCPALSGLSRETSSAEEHVVVAIHPPTGEVLALAGDPVVGRSLGTLVQPLIYLTALSQGYSAATLTMDVPSIYLQDGQPYSPRNADGQFLGPLRLREAVAAGRLVPATELLSWVGVDRTLATARAFGLAASSASQSPGLALAADGFPAGLLDVGRAFAAIGNGGTVAGLDEDEILPRPAFVRRVIDAVGNEVYSYDPATRDILSAEMAYLMADMLGGGEPAVDDGRSVAVASGVSAGGDGWAVGFSPDLLVAARATSDDLPAQVAQDVQDALTTWATELKAGVEWRRPAGLRSIEVCEISGLLPSRAGRCPLVTEWFIPGTEPGEVDTMVRDVAVNRETGRLATIFTPAHLIERRTTVAYPPEAAAWAESAGIDPPPAEYDTIRRIPTRVGEAELDIEPWSVVGQLGSPWSVTGSAGGEEFAYYRLAYFPGLLPEAMQVLVARGEMPVEAAELGEWDTTLVEDGLYTLLLTVVRQDGTFDEVAVPVTVENK